MGFIGLLGDVYMKLTMRNSDIFTHTRQQDEAYVRHFTNPVDDIERSYYQYQCQKWMDSSPIRYAVSNIASMVLMWPWTIKYLRAERRFVGESQRFDAVLTRDFLKDYLPADFKGTISFQDYNTGSLSKDDLWLLKAIGKRYPFSFYFRFKCMNRVAAYSDFIRKFKPSIVFSSCEYSFTSSVLTWYCESNGIEHINLMHGEKLYLPREAFSRFSSFYVWDPFYIDLFRSLRADRTRYLLSPMRLPSITIQSKRNCGVYYLGLETDDELKRIKEALEALGIDYKVRPHPVYETPGVRKIFPSDRIEETKVVSIWDSIANAGIVISLYSTVLYQAYLKGVTIMIDDVSNPPKYRNLFERDYIMMDKPHLLVSEELRKKY